MNRVLRIEVVRYGIAGTIGYVVNLVVLLGLVRIAGVDEYTALFPAFVANTVSNFLFIRYWTFGGAADRHVQADALRYLVVVGVLLAFNYLTFYIYFTVFGLNDATSQTLSILCGLPVGFTLNRRWAFAGDSHRVAPRGDARHTP